MIRHEWNQLVRDGLIARCRPLLMAFWPLRTVPPGYRGVITIGGSIRGIQQQGFTLLWPGSVLTTSTFAESVDVKMPTARQLTRSW